MKEAHDRSRVTPLGETLGRQNARLVEKAIAQLESEGEPDERCATCAFRLGTVPNGCEQTQMDALKCVMEGVIFSCHNDPENRVCHGWYSAWATSDKEVVKCPWPFSKPDEE